MAASIDQQFIEYIVKSIVGNPDAVKVDRRIDEKGVLLELSVDPEDLGRVIGKHGATAQSLRTLLRALGTKNDARYNLKIIDTGDGSHRSRRDEPAGEAPTLEEPAASPADNTSTAADDQTVSDQLEDEVVGEDDTASDVADMSAEESSSDRVSQTRKELAELDDLDV